MFESATHINAEDVLMDYQLPGKYFFLKTINGYEIDERQCQVRIYCQDKTFVIGKQSNLEYKKDDDGRIYLLYNDLKTRSPMLLKLPKMNEEDKTFSEFIDKIESYLNS